MKAIRNVPAKSSRESPNKRDAEHVVAVGELRIRLDRFDDDVGRASFRNGLGHRTTGSIAIATKSNAR